MNSRKFVDLWWMYWHVGKIGIYFLYCWRRLELKHRIFNFWWFYGFSFWFCSFQLEGYWRFVDLWWMYWHVGKIGIYFLYCWRKLELKHRIFNFYDFMDLVFDFIVFNWKVIEYVDVFIFIQINFSKKFLNS